MKKTIRLFGFIAFVAVIGFSFAACIEETDDTEPPVITTSSLPDGEVGTAYSRTLSADSPVGWSIDGGALPDGLDIDETTGVISGTPSKTGDFTFTVKAANYVGEDTKPLSITIKKPPIAMVQIQGGTFTMGSPKGESSDNYSDETQHEVTLTAFNMGKYEVTNVQYQAVMGTVPSPYARPNEPVGDSVNWYDVIVFCNTLSMQEGLTPAYKIDGKTDPAEWGAVPTASNSPNKEKWDAVEMVAGSTGYRLPTEAQWEYACRAGTTTAYNLGDTWSGDWGWYDANSEDTNSGDVTRGKIFHPVGQKTANAWGLYDMHGNVAEWCWDWYNTYSSDAQTDPTGAASGTRRVTRGGSYYIYNVDVLRSAARGSQNPSERDVFGRTGFRLVLPAPGAPKISSDELPVGRVEKAYTPHTLLATGNATITWSHVTAGGALPGGLTLAATGVISGTPTEDGTFTFTVKAANTAGSDTKRLSIKIEWEPTSGLEFTLINSDTEYSVKKGTATDARIVIPPVYEGLPVTTIGEDGFRSYTAMTSVIIPDSVTTFEQYAFRECSNLKSVTIPGSVANTGYWTFYGCDKLESVTIENGVTTICSYMFYNCTALTSVTIPDSVENISAYAFRNCKKLTSVTIPDGVKSIGQQAFQDCEVLESVIIPDSVATIGSGAFQGCKGLKSVTLSNIITTLSSQLFYQCGELTSVTIPGTVESIGEGAFSECRKLTGVIIPNSVKSIGASAFSYCSGLESVTIGNNVVSIGASAFTFCINLPSVTIPASVTSIGASAFHYLPKLTSVTFLTGSNITSGNFASNVFPFQVDGQAVTGDFLRTAYLGTEGGAGTYTRTIPPIGDGVTGSTQTPWAKQGS